MNMSLAVAAFVVVSTPAPIRALGAADLFIAASGDTLRNNHGHGDVVTLRGVNLGGWLVFERWMTPMDSSKLPDEHSARVVLTRRFGAAKSDELVGDYEDHWITDDDLGRIAAAGLNTVRAPFWYRTVETEDGVWRPDSFRHLDWVVQHAGTHGLYVVLDLHGVPGGPKPALIIGGDVSALPDMEKAGAIYRDESGKPGDGLVILHDHGMNAFRLRLFVDPDRNFDHTAGANQDLPAVLAMAKRVKATGAKLIVDLHYADTWADPAHQQKPKAWAGLHGDELERKVESYTADVMQKLKANGTPPDFVQIGNETTDGLLFPDGKLSGDDKADDGKRWTAVGRLLSAGSRGVRSVFPKDQTRVIIHISSGGKAGVPTWYFDHIAEQKVDFDVIGLSFYPMWGDSMDELKKNLAGLTKHGKQLMIMETAEPYRDHQVKADAKISWPLTPAGQKQFLAELVEVVAQTPGGIGVVWWYPEIEDRPKMRIWEGAATSWFDQNGRVLPIGR
jgi:arabinogalactan endo-1,4-beta-galactosidase